MIEGKTTVARRAEGTLVVLYIWSSVLAGPLKYIALTISVPVHLFFKMSLFLSIVSHFVLLRAKPFQLFVGLTVLFLVYIGHSHRLPLFQVAFGVWALLPLIFGLLFPDVMFSQYVKRSLVLIFCVSVVGEFLSYFIVFPWAGMSVEIGGVATTVAREWSAGSARRLAGFTASSVDLSVVLACFGIVFMFQSKQLLTRTIVMIVVGAAIYATTMKTALLAFLLACLPLLASIRILRVVTGLTAFSAMFFGIIIPFTLKSDFIGIISFIRRHHFETLLARIDVTWPNVFEYLRHAGTGVWGIGLGGLGSAAAAGNNPFPYAFVDNFYLILIGTAGLVGIFFLLMFTKRIWSGAFGPIDETTRIKLPLLAFFAIYGVSQPLIEASVGVLFLGAALTDAPRRKTLASAKRVIQYVRTVPVLRDSLSRGL